MLLQHTGDSVGPPSVHLCSVGPCGKTLQRTSSLHPQQLVHPEPHPDGHAVHHLRAAGVVQLIAMEKLEAAYVHQPAVQSQLQRGSDAHGLHVPGLLRGHVAPTPLLLPDSLQQGCHNRRHLVGTHGPLGSIGLEFRADKRTWDVLGVCLLPHRPSTAAFCGC